MIPIVFLRQQFMARAAKRNDNVIKALLVFDLEPLAETRNREREGCV
jgi:hypothetical protein